MCYDNWICDLGGMAWHGAGVGYCDYGVTGVLASYCFVPVVLAPGSFAYSSSAWKLG